NASRFADDRDVVLVGYRGVDGSVRLDCPEVVSAMKRAGDVLSERAIDARMDAFAECADRLRDDGVDLAGYTLPQRVDDLEAARRALGYGRIDLLSESAGTRTAMIYAWRHPESIHRSAMIAVNPPGHFLWDPETADEQLRRYAELCERDDACGPRTDDLAATLRPTAADVPDRWWFLPINEGSVRAGSFWGLMESRSNVPLSAPMTIDTWLSAAGGDASGLWFLSLGADFMFPTAQVWGDVAAVARVDASAARRYFASAAHRPGSSFAAAANEFVWGGGRLLDSWPANAGDDAYSRVRTSDVETLLVGGELDFATPPAAATEELLPRLPNGRQVVLEELGHTTDFWTYRPDASSRLLNTFFASGKVDNSLYRPPTVDFAPSATHTTLAKGFVAAMVGLALAAVVWLLLMTRRVRRRGGYGRKASAALRSLSPVVLGLGGWFLAALVVLTAELRVPLDDELLAPLSVGIPVGLGLYLAWVNRDWSAWTKTVGFAGAVGSALVGAWLGFNATEGLVALLTAIVGAAVGGNLVLLVLDIAWDRQARDRFVEPTAKETLEARPSTP
ncbi:MAG TPA: alpha/beta hydrolase, partial [Gaiellaceae bacterium]|nr:alpha/beta hydrolase [Gaiellaceae bacterium]